MASVATPAIIAVIVLLVLNGLAGYWLYTVSNGLNKCEKEQHIACPYMMCKTPDSDCGVSAFRIDTKTGKKICDVPLTSKISAKVKPNT